MTTAALKTRRSRVDRRDQAERRLIQATMDVIATRGVSAATFEAIGARAGYSRGLATQHFGSKQGLIEAVVSYLLEQQAEGLEQLEAQQLSGCETILGFVRHFCASIRSSNETKAYFMLLGGLVADADALRDIFAQSHAQTKTRLVRLIRKGQADGSIGPNVDPTTTALMIGSLLVGLTMQALVDPGTHVARIERTVEAFLTSGLAPVKSRRVQRG